MADRSLPAPDAFPRRRTVHGVAATLALAAAAAETLRGGEIILLHGPLGAGKTCFCQGLCRGLGVMDEVVSPTFTLLNTYAGRLRVHHLDFYRVAAEQSLEDIGVPGVLDEVWDGEAVAVVEWPALLLPELGAAPRLELLALPGGEADTRIWYLRAEPDLPPAWAELFPGEDGAC